MANPYQLAARRRRISYIGGIAVLFVLTLFLRGTVTKASPVLHDLTIDGRAARLEMTELEQQGEAELSGSAVRLLLTGSRGIAISILWISANEKQVKNDWNELDVIVRSITKLQPHFITPWLFQSWNLTYNVSVELDRLNDMYFWISRGINLLAEGERINKRNPDMRYSLAFYYQNKFSVSDKVNTLRCLYQMSCIHPDDRRAEDLLNPDGRTVDSDKFLSFCQKNPQLIRRLRESTVQLQRPEDVVRFLRDNAKVPTRFVFGKRDFNDRTSQFPVLPPTSTSSDDDPSPGQEIPDRSSDAVIAARSWFRYSLTVLPPASERPDRAPFQGEYDATKYRVPKQPMLIIFRQGAPRAQTYIAERLQKEGWMDAAPWVMDLELASDDSNRWFREDVRLEPSMNSQDAWTSAYEMWLRHGESNGLYVKPERLLEYQEQARKFAQWRGITVETDAPPVNDADLPDDETRQSYKAMQTLTYYRQNIQVTQFFSFLYGSEGEMAADTVKARSLLNSAERYRRAPFTNEVKSRREYVKAFAAWKDVLRNKPNLRANERIQEDLCEAQIEYLKQVTDANKPALRASYAAITEILNSASPTRVGMPGLPLTFAFDRMSNRFKDRPMPLMGPLDQNDGPEGAPWIRDDIRVRVYTRLKIINPVGPESAPLTQATPVPAQIAPGEAK